MECARKIVHQVQSARIPVRLKQYVHTFPAARFRRRQRGLNLRRMMSVVVHHGDALRLAAYFKPASYAQLFSRFSGKRDAVLRVVPQNETPKIDRATQSSTVASSSDLPNAAPVCSGVTFAVDNVMPAEKPIWSETLADSLSRRYKRRILVLPDSEMPVVNAKAASALRFRDDL